MAGKDNESIQEIMNLVYIYHITKRSAAEKIMRIGFDPSVNKIDSGNSFFFTNKENIDKWCQVLQNERKNDNEWKNGDISVIEVIVSKHFFEKSFLNQFGWKSGHYMYKGHKEILQQSPFKWIKTEIVPLRNGSNCKMRIM